jgi:hypothetical protein
MFAEYDKGSDGGLEFVRGVFMTDAEKATILSRLLASIEVMHAEAMSVGAHMLAQQLEGARKEAHWELVALYQARDDQGAQTAAAQR